RMASNHTRCGVIARNGEHIRFLAEQNGQGRIKLLNRFFLGGKIAVLTIFISVLEMDEEETKVLVLREVTLELFFDRLRPFDFFHADELCETLVHRIDRQRYGLEPVPIFEQRNIRLVSYASHEKTVGRFLPVYDGQGGF